METVAVLPSLAEAGVDVNVSAHFAFHATKGNQADTLTKLTTALADLAADAAFKRVTASTRTRVEVLPPDAPTRVPAEEQARFEPVIPARRK